MFVCSANNNCHFVARRYYIFPTQISLMHFSEVLIISDWCKHHARCCEGGKWISHARLLAEVLSTSIEYVKCIKFQEDLDSHGSPGPESLVPRSTVFTNPGQMPKSTQIAQCLHIMSFGHTHICPCKTNSGTIKAGSWKKADAVRRGYGHGHEYFQKALLHQDTR